MFAQGKMPARLNYQPGNPAYKTTWDDIVDGGRGIQRARQVHDLIGFEWTSLVKGNNLHRNVIFRDSADKATQIVPFTTTPRTAVPIRAICGSGCRPTRTRRADRCWPSRTTAICRTA